MKKPSDAHLRRLRMRAHDLSKKNDDPKTATALLKLLRLLRRRLFSKKKE